MLISFIFYDTHMYALLEDVIMHNCRQQGMPLRNNAVVDAGRIRARDMYNLTRVLDVMLSVIEEQDKELERVPIQLLGKKTKVCIYRCVLNAVASVRRKCYSCKN